MRAIFAFDTQYKDFGYFFVSNIVDRKLQGYISTNLTIYYYLLSFGYPCCYDHFPIETNVWKIWVTDLQYCHQRCRQCMICLFLYLFFPHDVLLCVVASSWPSSFFVQPCLLGSQNQNLKVRKFGISYLFQFS